MILTKEQIIAASKPTLREVEIPAWGGSIYVRPMSYREQNKLLDLKINRESNLEVYDSLLLPTLANCICDENGDPLFTTEELGSYLSKLNNDKAGEIQRIVSKALALNKSAVEEMEKNSQETSGASSQSGTEPV